MPNAAFHYSARLSVALIGFSGNRYSFTCTGVSATEYNSGSGMSAKRMSRSAWTVRAKLIDICHPLGSQSETENTRSGRPSSAASRMRMKTSDVPLPATRRGERKKWADEDDFL
jgi:hypothetical protein